MGLFDSTRRWLAGDETPATPSTPIARQMAPSRDAPPAAQIEAPAFPYPLITVHGSNALATWRHLRADGQGWPVVLGNDEDVEFIREGIEEMDERRPEDILAIAATLSFPESLRARREEDDRQAREWLRERGQEDEGEDPFEAPLGDWPDSVGPSDFSVAFDVLTGRPFDRVHIAVLPCATGWEAMAHLRWGNWNENPAAEYHVAALKHWNAAFGAELVGCSHDVINLHVATRPATRETALQLARDQYLYCNDVVDQGAETLSALAATLMAGDWWYFWWD